MTGTSSPASVPLPNHSSVVPSEVGWQFVPQYYTFVNKEPHRLHCFYNKNSTFIHGTEGEDGKPCYGQQVCFFLFCGIISRAFASNSPSNKSIHQEIHNKITSIGFQDCKVFIHSVDAQSSANGGIIIQVIGEMSNHGDPWRKFVQTFFLAEQPNGYFVLNDIFRFLKEEAFEGDGVDDDVQEPTVLEPAPVAQTAASAPEPTYEPARELTPPPAVEPQQQEALVADEAPTTDISEPHVTQTPTPAPEEHIPPPPVTVQPNGIHTPEPEKPAVVVAPVELSPVPTPTARLPTPTPASASAPAPAPATNATSSVPTPVAAPAPPVTHSQSTATLVPAPTPQAPRSWASLAASNPKKWGAAVNQESRGTTEILSNPVPATNGNGNPAQASQSVPAPNSAPQHHHQHQHQHQRGGGGQHGGQGGNQGGPRHDHPAVVAAQSVSHAQCFVKVSLYPSSFLFYLLTSLFRA